MQVNQRKFHHFSQFHHLSLIQFPKTPLPLPLKLSLTTNQDNPISILRITRINHKTCIPIPRITADGTNLLNITEMDSQIIFQRDSNLVIIIIKILTIPITVGSLKMERHSHLRGVMATKVQSLHLDSSLGSRT